MAIEKPVRMEWIISLSAITDVVRLGVDIAVVDVVPFYYCGFKGCKKSL